MAIHFYPPQKRDKLGRFKKKSFGVFKDEKGRFVSKSRAFKSSIARREYSEYTKPKTVYKPPSGYETAPLRGPEAVEFRGPQNDQLDLDTDSETPNDLIDEIRDDRADILQQEDKKS